MIEQWKKQTEALEEQYGMGGAYGLGEDSPTDFTRREVIVKRGPFKGLRGTVSSHNKKTGEIVMRRMPNIPIHLHIKDLMEDSTPSQMQGLDPSQDVGIVGGPLGEDDPSKTVATIKRVVRAKYKRKLL
jgi:hypothetical protein